MKEIIPRLTAAFSPAHEDLVARATLLLELGPAPPSGSGRSPDGGGRAIDDGIDGGTSEASG